MTLHSKEAARCSNSGQKQSVEDWVNTTETVCLSCGRTVPWKARMSDLPPWGVLAGHRTNGVLHYRH